MKKKRKSLTGKTKQNKRLFHNTLLYENYFCNLESNSPSILNVHLNSNLSWDKGMPVFL